MRIFCLLSTNSLSFFGQISTSCEHSCMHCGRWIKLRFTDLNTIMNQVFWLFGALLQLDIDTATDLGMHCVCHAGHSSTICFHVCWQPVVKLLCNRHNNKYSYTRLIAVYFRLLIDIKCLLFIQNTWHTDVIKIYVCSAYYFGTISNFWKRQFTWWSCKWTVKWKSNARCFQCCVCVKAGNDAYFWDS